MREKTATIYLKKHLKEISESRTETPTKILVGKRRRRQDQQQSKFYYLHAACIINLKFIYFASVLFATHLHE